MVAGRLASALNSSLVIRALAPLWRGSLVCRGLACFARSLSGRSSWMGTLLANHPPSHGFPRATRVAVTSAMLTWIDRVFVSAGPALQSSVARRVLLEKTLASLEPWQRVRFIGWMIVVTATVHAMLSFSTLVQSTWGMRAFAGFVAAGIGLLLASRPVAAAWGSWRRRR